MDLVHQQMPVPQMLQPEYEDNLMKFEHIKFRKTDDFELIIDRLMELERFIRKSSLLEK